MKRRAAFRRLGVGLLLAAALRAEPAVEVVRLPNNPIIRPEMLPDDKGVNINGPSLIRVPDWLPHPLGRYYLYFANHRGGDLRLAYADRIEGPWTIQRPGPLTIETVAVVNHETPDAKSHIASPDVWIDEAKHQIRLYFHYRLPKAGHVSGVAVSGDGRSFTVQPGAIGEPYLRMFRYGDWFYFIDRRGQFLRSRDGLTGFETGPAAVWAAVRDQQTGAELRHTAVRLRGDQLEIYLTRVGDVPERVLRSSVQLTPDWRTWRPSPPELILAPATEYEGASLPVAPSEKGDAKGREHALRDPGIFEENGRVYLLYSVAGEFGLAIAELKTR